MMIERRDFIKVLLLYFVLMLTVLSIAMIILYKHYIEKRPKVYQIECTKEVEQYKKTEVIIIDGDRIEQKASFPRQIFCLESKRVAL
jgi:hypothetical protein